MVLFQVLELLRLETNESKTESLKSKSKTKQSRSRDEDQSWDLQHWCVQSTTQEKIDKVYVWSHNVKITLSISYCCLVKTAE